MAQRRMFSLKIVDTDVFLSMPISSRCLYYDLAMRADDDGFIGSPKKIQRVVGCSDDDFNILLQKQYIIPFRSGVCVVKDWNMHNCIRKDRYTKTIYSEEKGRLEIDENGRYCEKNEENESVIPSVIPMVNTEQVSIDQIKIEQQQTKRAHAYITDDGFCQDVNYVDNSHDVVVLCEKCNLNTSDVLFFMEKYGENYVKSKLLLLSMQKNVKNKGAWIRSAVENDYHLKQKKQIAKADINCKKCHGTGYITFVENLTNETLKMKCDYCIAGR